VLYLNLARRAVVFLVAIFGKRERVDFSAVEIRELAKLVKWLKESAL